MKKYLDSEIKKRQIVFRGLLEHLCGMSPEHDMRQDICRSANRVLRELTELIIFREKINSLAL